MNQKCYGGPLVVDLGVIASTLETKLRLSQAQDLLQSVECRFSLHLDQPQTAEMPYTVNEMLYIDPQAVITPNKCNTRCFT